MKQYYSDEKRLERHRNCCHPLTETAIHSSILSRALDELNFELLWSNIHIWYVVLLSLVLRRS